MATIQTAPRAPAPAPTSGRMKLANVTSGKVLDAPMRLVVYGIHGVGKSGFAAAAPAPIFLCPENGADHIDVPRFDEPETWGDVLDAVRELTVTEHSYKTFVIDTLDWLEPLCWRELCRRVNKPGVPLAEAYGYGKGFDAAVDEWRILLSRLERLRKAKSMHVILLAHSWVKTFKNPAGDDFDRYQLKLHEKSIGPIKEWSDAVLFAMHDDATVESENGRVKGISSGARILRTQHSAAWEAKNRYSLPERMPLSWHEFEAAVKKGADPDKLREEIDKALAVLNDAELEKTVRAYVSSIGNKTAELAESLNRLKVRINAMPPQPQSTE